MALVDAHGQAVAALGGGAMRKERGEEPVQRQERRLASA
jgi:hypothetical protein